jgi:GTP-binding protein
MKFVDEVTIDVKSGRGGAGMVSFMSQSYMPKMGPDGGDGGRGGHVYFVATHDMQSLLDFQINPYFSAQDGEGGMGKDCNGHSGKDLLIQVPMGTALYDAKTNEFIADLIEPGVQVRILKGGRGGLGNMNFATPSRQAPDFAQTGEGGEERKIRLELKLIADVALVGFPNAGKSTLISHISAAKPKIAPYPFTTLTPNLGVVRSHGYDFVVADVPGLIEGASEGRGLGIRFLKHTERTRLLVMLLDLDPSTGRNLASEFKLLRTEIEKFSDELGNKPFVVVLNKSDAFGDPSHPLFLEFLQERGVEDLRKLMADYDLDSYHLISAVSGQGLEDLTTMIAARLKTLGPKPFENNVAASLVMGNAALFDQHL